MSTPDTANYRIVGHVVERTTWPRMRVPMFRADDGSWHSGQVEQIDPLPNPPSADDLRNIARIMREVGDAFHRELIRRKESS